MSERFIEANLWIDSADEMSSKHLVGTIDLEHVQVFRAVENSEWTRVILACGHLLSVKMSYADFKKLHTAYQASKVFPGYPGVPTTPVEPFTPTEPYAPTETSDNVIWTGESDTTTTIRLNKKEIENG